MASSSASTMRTLAVPAWGTPPTLTEVSKPPTPGSSDETVQIRILASGLANLVRSQASGTHYSVRNATLPYIPGIEAVGYTPDSQLVHVNLFSAKPQGGGFAEYVNGDKRVVTVIPCAAGPSSPEARDIGIKVASLLNPAMSSWMALKYRANIGSFAATQTPFSVLILGVTSASGRIAALFARHLGAKTVIGAARSPAALADLKQRGIIDEAVALDKDDVTRTDYSVLTNPANIANYPLVVLDYIWGATALSAMTTLPASPNQSENLEVRWVQIGTLGADQDVAVTGPLLRSKNITLSGSGPGSWSLKALQRETPDLIKAVVEVVPADGWRKEYGVVERKLEDVDAAWAEKGARTVFVME